MLTQYKVHPMKSEVQRITSAPPDKKLDAEGVEANRPLCKRIYLFSTSRRGSRLQTDHIR